MPFVRDWEGLVAVLRFLTAGESHGPMLSAVLEGLPAGVSVCAEAIDRELSRRCRGYGRGGRMKIENDAVTIAGGVRHGLSLGSPIALTIANRDWENWREEMTPAPPTPGWETTRRVHVPRPGHADLAGATKYRQRDMRNVLERASARETAARVAVGATCRSLLDELGVRVVSAVCRIGDAHWESPAEWSDEIIADAERSDVRCPDETVAAAMRSAVDAARADGDSVGGVFEVRAIGVPPGLGSHVFWDRRLDSRLAAAFMGIPAIKGVEIGLGFGASAKRGSDVHDPIITGQGAWPVGRSTNNAGGLEGGISNGEPIVLRAAMKPIPTLTSPLPSIDIDDLCPAAAHAERSDVCAVPAAAVVGEAAVCFELARAALEKFGGDHIRDVLAALKAYREDRGRIWGPVEGA